MNLKIFPSMAEDVKRPRREHIIQQAIQAKAHLKDHGGYSPPKKGDLKQATYEDVCKKRFEDYKARHDGWRRAAKAYLLKVSRWGHRGFAQKLQQTMSIADKTVQSLCSAARNRKSRELRASSSCMIRKSRNI